MNRPIREVADPEDVERLLDASPHLVGRQPEVGRAERDVREDVRREQLIRRILKHELHELSMTLQPAPRTLQRHPVDDDVP